ncbi:hypothetical protein AAG906_020925 [Vitis piasezkii]
MVWDDFDRLPMASLSTKFRMLEIERYTGIGCPCIHLRLYSTMMRAHGLDDAQMIMLFPMSLSGVAYLQPRFARHLMGFPHVDFGSLVQALYANEKGITRGLWLDSSPSNSKGKKLAIGRRLGDSPIPFRLMSPTYLHPAPQPVYTTQATQRSTAHYP